MLQSMGSQRVRHNCVAEPLGDTHNVIFKLFITLKLPANGISQHSRQRRPPEARLKEFRPCGGGLVTKSCPTLATPWTIARQAPPSMGFSRQEYWSWLPFPSPNPGIDPRSPALQRDSLPTELQGKPLGTPESHQEPCPQTIAVKTHQGFPGWDIRLWRAGARPGPPCTWHSRGSLLLQQYLDRPDPGTPLPPASDHTGTFFPASAFGVSSLAVLQHPEQPTPGVELNSLLPISREFPDSSGFPSAPPQGGGVIQHLVDLHLQTCRTYLSLASLSTAKLWLWTTWANFSASWPWRSLRAPIPSP